jgi:uroporphyrin-3 C-methyltransferase
MLFTVRRTEQPVARLLPPEQQALLGEVLALRLEAARGALLRADTPAFRDALKSAEAWLDEYYRSDDPGVLAAQADLEKLEALDLDPALPDLSRSLRLLRAYLDTAPK